MFLAFWKKDFDKYKILMVIIAILSIAILIVLIIIPLQIKDLSNYGEKINMKVEVFKIFKYQIEIDDTDKNYQQKDINSKKEN